MGLTLVALVGLVGLALVGRGRCDAQCLALGVRLGRCGEPCPEGQPLHEVRLQQGGEGQRLLRGLLCVPRHDGLLQGLQLAGAKLIFMRDGNASNTGANS